MSNLEIIRLKTKHYGDILTICTDDIIWFSIDDILQAVRDENDNDIIEDCINADETNQYLFRQNEFEQTVLMINAAGVFRIINKVNTPVACAFKEQFLYNYIPTIRKYFDNTETRRGFIDHMFNALSEHTTQNVLIELQQSDIQLYNICEEVIKTQKENNRTETVTDDTAVPHKYLDITYVREKKEPFIAMAYQPLEPLDLNISPIDLTRLIYLSTFMNDENCLVKKVSGRYVPIDRSECSKMIRIKNSIFDSFWAAIIDNGLVVYKDEKIYLNNSVFRRGKVFSRSASVCFNINGIRALCELYRNVSIQKYMSYLFQIIPWVNKSWNVVCQCPCESDIENIKPVSLTEFAALVDYDENHARHLGNELCGLMFGKDCSFMSAMYYFSDSNKSKKKHLYVNPNLYYVNIK